jgi:hypothetical protein
MILLVIPGRAEGASPESITAAAWMWHDGRVAPCFVVMDPGLAAEPVIGPRFARTRWRRPGMTSGVC